MIRANKAFELENGENFRELGAYLTQDNKMIQSKKFIRAGDTSRLSPRDLEFLLDYGVRLEIDLRSEFETEASPSKLMEDERVQYLNVAMLDGMATMVEGKEMPDSMYQVYKNLLEGSKEDYKKIFKAILECEGTILFHCSAGKDRTGVLAMLLLDLAKVDRETILVDYEASEDNLKDLIERQVKDFEAKGGFQIPRHFLGSKRIDMDRTLDHLYENYGNAEGYLKDIGMEEGEIEGIKSILVG